jgi:hypothetical protein
MVRISEQASAHGLDGTIHRKFCKKQQDSGIGFQLQELTAIFPSSWEGRQYEDRIPG